MRYVLDSSVAFKWHVREADTDKVLFLRDDFARGVCELIAPDVLPVEVAHALTRAERQRRITPTEGAVHLRDMFALLPDLHPHLPLLPRAYTISSTARQGVYDCLYVALAEREGCQLVTADDKMVKNLQALFPFVIALSSLP